MEIIMVIFIVAVVACWAAVIFLEYRRHQLKKDIEQSKRRIDTLAFMVNLNRYLSSVINDAPSAPDSTKQMAEDIAILIALSHGESKEDAKD